MAEPELKPTSVPSRRPWAQIILVLSLGLNLLFLGLIGGAFLREGPPGRAATVRELNFGALTEALSKDDRETLRRSFQRTAPDLKAQRRDIESDMAEFLTALRAPEFQRAKVEALFTRNTDRTARRRELGQNLMLDLLVAMTLDGRSAFADRLEVAMKRPKKRADP